jgi:hypothetical protein
VNNYPSRGGNVPMASADFGAESGAYFLKSVSTIEGDSRTSDPNTTRIRHQKKKRTPKIISGAQADNATTKIQDTAPLQGCAATVRWETLPGCLIESVVGVTQDLTQRFLTGDKVNESLGDIVTKNNRLNYLLIIFLLLFFVYRILR